LKLFLNLIDVACVITYVLWMLKYPKTQQKKNNRKKTVSAFFGIRIGKTVYKKKG